MNWTFGVEALDGDQLTGGEPAEAGEARDVGVLAYTASVTGHIGDRHHWRFGLSYLDNRLVAYANDHYSHRDGDHEHGHGGHEHVHGARYSGENMYMANFAWTWAPEGEPEQRHVRLSAEYARVTDLTAYATSDDIHEAWYVASVYHFLPQWEVGLRYGELSVSEPHHDHFHPGELNEAAAMLAWQPTHGSTIRLQYSRQDADAGFDNAGDAFLVQYVLTLGHHHHAHDF